jgi:hypothetical protein
MPGGGRAVGDAVERLVARWGDLQLRFVADIRDARAISDDPAAAAALALAQAALDRCVVEIADALRAKLQDKENSRYAHAQRLRKARQVLFEARRVLECAHRLVAKARELQSKDQKIRERDARVRERMRVNDARRKK